MQSIGASGAFVRPAARFVASAAGLRGNPPASRRQGAQNPPLCRPPLGLAGPLDLLSTSPLARLVNHPIQSFPRLQGFPGRPAAVAAAVALLVLSGCATTGQPTASVPQAAPRAASTAPAAAPAPAPAAPAGASAGATPAAGTTPGAGPAARPDPAAPHPFAEIIKDATRQDGFVPVWRKDEKVWLEIAPERLNKPLLFTVNIAQSVGERGLYASAMARDWMVEFRRVGTQVQVLARQMGFRGDRDPASARAVAEGFSDSLIAAAAVGSAPHPERKSVLIDASFLLADIAGTSTQLEGAFRLPFAPDRANSSFESTRAEAGLTTLKAKIHYAVARIPAPPLLPPGAPAPLLPPPPRTTPDARSLFVTYVYNFRELPAQPMATRLADPRVGFFTDSYADLSDDLKPNNRVDVITRWRLEKKDPAAALSEPVKPITFWLDRNIPQRYRAAVTAGILEWNKAFERIGFKNAIVARQQADDADFDNMDAGHASIRWFLGADVGFAQGPSHSDPRTGEILDADIRMADVFGRGARRQAREDAFSAGFAGQPAWRQSLDSLWDANASAKGGANAFCNFAAEGAQELDFALDLLEARGEMDPDSPEAEKLAQDYVKDVITHEVGHTLGMRHNFRASTTVSATQLRDKNLAAARGISGSVMDYNPFNLSLASEPKSEPNMTGLGTYDYWAIEYAYKPVTPAKEAEELKAIVERSRTDPGLAFADDGDNFTGLDPRINQFDLGEDPLAYAQRRVALSKELWQRVQERGVKPGDDALRLRRSLLAGLNQMSRVPPMAAKYVGGMYTERDIQGTGKTGFKPVEPARQRQALKFLNEEIFATDSFRFKPEFLASLTPDYVEFQRTLVSIPQTVLALQTQTLDSLLAPGTARRLLELPLYLPAAEQRGAISLNEVYTTVQGAIWSELKTGKDIDPMRRSLQREHLKRLQGILTRPNPQLPADAVSLARLQAVELQTQLRAAAGKPGLSVENRAHLQDALALVTEALKATLQRG